MVHDRTRSRWVAARSWIGLLGAFAGLAFLLGPGPVAAQSTPRKPADRDAAKAKDDDEAKNKDEEGPEQKAATAPDVAGVPAADPSQSTRVAPLEVFKDPAAAALMDMARLNPLTAPQFTPAEVQLVNEMAATPNLNFNRALVERVVKGLAARLTDRKSIQELLEEPDPEKAADAKKKAEPREPGRTVEQATLDLLTPLFKARAAQNTAFLTSYRRILVQYLPPLLKNHLVPRIQAMIVLGESGARDAFPIFQNEIASRSQALWVKLWALEGITNIKRSGERFRSDEEAKAAKVISDFLSKNKDLPWPIQLRGIEALGALRQAYLANDPASAPMANTSMAFLADPEARLEVRAEAARTLGLLQVSEVPQYNFKLVAYSAGQLAAELASQLNEQYHGEKPPHVDNRTKANYLAALLVGPVFQCFEGVSGQSRSGLLQLAVGNTDSMKYVQKVLDLIKPLAQSSVTLLGSPPLQFKTRKAELDKQIAALRKFLDQNPPANRRLVPNGRDFGGGDAAAAREAEHSQPLASTRRGR